jgi:hypothetical protein
MSATTAATFLDRLDDLDQRGAGLADQIDAFLRLPVAVVDQVLDVVKPPTSRGACCPGNDT